MVLKEVLLLLEGGSLTNHIILNNSIVCQKIDSLCIHAEIYQRIEGRVCHGEPEEGQEHVLRVLVAHH